MFFFAFLFAVLGYFIGVHVTLLIQGVAIVAIVLFLNSRYVASFELGALGFIGAGLMIIIGMIAGNIVFAIAHGFPDLAINWSRLFTGS